MADWLNNMDKDEREEFESNIACIFTLEEFLIHIWDTTKEKRALDEDWYVEFTADSEGNLNGAVLTYNLQADYVNLTIPIWVADVQVAWDKETVTEKVDAITETILQAMRKLQPYIDAASVAI